MSYNLTNKERQIAINQLTSLDIANSAMGAAKLQTTYRIVPIPPKSDGEPERWVAVEPLSKNIQTNIRQPDPERAVLCASWNNFGCINYCYGDKLSCYIISSVIFTAIFSVFSTPLLLLCCIPMIRNLMKARSDIESGDNVGARKECNRWLCWCVGASVWAITVTTIVVVGVTFAIVFSVIDLSNNTQRTA